MGHFFFMTQPWLAYLSCILVYKLGNWVAQESTCQGLSKSWIEMEKYSVSTKYCHQSQTSGNFNSPLWNLMYQLEQQNHSMPLVKLLKTIGYLVCFGDFTSFISPPILWPLNSTLLLNLLSLNRTFSNFC